MPNWVEAILIRVFSRRNIEVDQWQLSQEYLQVDVPDLGNLELNYLSQDEALLVSLRLGHRVDDDILKVMLELNSYCNQSLLSPTCHLFSDHIVLRLLIHRENLDVVSFEAALNNLYQVNQSVVGF
ncbi:hypothetical protein [Microbulbifer sp. JMSA003]|uniref:hypothetical protein n=1 Tax=Microbulbifer sp. JMSA003 TaxID=3243369 RepID=UPI0040398EF7